jgi:outer membrane protein TolC
MKNSILVLILLWAGLVFGQSNAKISLQQCLLSTEQNYPLSDQKKLLVAANELKLEIIQSGFLPQFMLNAQVSYQSEVTNLPITLPNVTIPQTSKDWYKLNVDISQLIYDGGVLKQQQQLEKSQMDIDVKSLEIELYKVKEMVQSAYFNYLLLQENKKTILLLQNELNEKLKSIESAVKNGVMQASNRDNLKAELIKIAQNIFELELGLESAITGLNVLTGMQITKDQIFAVPETQNEISIQNNRPELQYFDLQKSKIELLKEMTSLKRKPKIMCFGQAGYGRPGLNMLSNDFEPYYMVGARLNWNIFDWKKTKKEIRSFDIQSQIIDKNKEAFNTNLEVLLNKKQMEIHRLKSLIESDGQIVSLKKNVAKAASSQFENGLITATEYLLEKNAETKAVMNLHLHKVQLQYAQIDYEYTIGNLN